MRGELSDNGGWSGGRGELDAGGKVEGVGLVGTPVESGLEGAVWRCPGRTGRGVCSSERAARAEGRSLECEAWAVCVVEL